MADEIITAALDVVPPSKDKAAKKQRGPDSPAAEKTDRSQKAGKLEGSVVVTGAKGEKLSGDAQDTHKPTSNEPVAGTAPTADELLGDDLASKKIVKIKGAKNVIHGIAYIVATFNNTHVSISDIQGNVIGWSSAGRVGFKGSRKSTAYAAQQVAQDAGRQAMSHGLREVEVRVKGPGSGRESAIRALQAIGLDISTIKDITPVPHNGCRPRKKRRV